MFLKCSFEKQTFLFFQHASYLDQINMMERDSGIIIICALSLEQYMSISKKAMGSETSSKKTCKIIDEYLSVGIFYKSEMNMNDLI